MTHLTPDQIAELAAELHRVAKKLERSVRSTADAMRPIALDRCAVGQISHLDSLQNQDRMRNLREREQAKLGQVATALERMEAGTYGVCLECSGAIPLERLQLFPETPTCTSCSPV